MPGKFRRPKIFGWQSARRKFFGYVRKRVPPLAMAYAAYKGVKYLKGIVNSEMHSKTATQQTGNAVSGATTIQFMDIAQGDSNSTRTGNTILAKYVGLRLTLKRNPTTNTTQTTRIMVVQDNQQISDSAPAMTDVLNGQTVHAFVNQNFGKGRFKILYDRRFTTQDNGKMQHFINIGIPLNHHVRYNGTASTDIQGKGVYAFIVGDVASNGDSFTYDSITKFYDN